MNLTTGILSSLRAFVGPLGRISMSSGVLVATAALGLGACSGAADHAFMDPDGSVTPVSTNPSCGDGLQLCGASCVDPRTDRDHCGACGNACASGQSCVAGSCQAMCAPGQSVCEGACSDLRRDTAHCGACGHSCGTGEVCDQGVCTVTCSDPLTRCNASPTHPAGYCADTANDPNNCGTCGASCALPNVADPTCTRSACAIHRCADGFADCDGVSVNGCEVQVASDANHCGACGHACGLGMICVAGACTPKCASGSPDCV